MKNPPFCPNPHCSYHTDAGRPSHWFIRKGFYATHSGNRYQRYQCSHCQRRFSSKTFHIDYFAKVTLDYHRLLTYLVSGMSLRALGRAFHRSPKTIAGKISILTRQFIAFNHDNPSVVNLAEDLVADGFESYVVSQYFPNNFNLLIGKDSQFVYDLTYAYLRRKGAMTDAQKKLAVRYRVTDPLPAGQIQVSFTHLLRTAAGLLRVSSRKTLLILHTDEKKEYVAPLAGYASAGLPDPLPLRILHRQTPSSVPRTGTNPLFPANYIDRDIRKDMAEHHRETVCFARNVNASLERLTCYLFHHNFIKAFRINRADRTFSSHAVAAGLDARFIRKRLAFLFTRRAFFTRLSLPLPGELLWRRGYFTPRKAFCDCLPAYVLA
ncbi:MAG: hypothetical protein JW760_07045 [Spirochaetales bacterium]|nr:hypothetical protein [Spirochaetales bacterium]